MPSFLALLAFLTAAGLTPEHVRIPTPSGTMLDAALVRPANAIKGPAIVALHGCGGPYPSRDGSWAVELVRLGHAVLLPDSFGSRGLGSQCRAKKREVTPARQRRDDAIAAARWLTDQPWTPPGGIALMGWSNGGSTVLATANEAAGLPNGLFTRFVALYPGCSGFARSSSWHPAGPLLILIGASDDWTPAAPCQVLAERFPAQIHMIEYPGAYHDFDAPGRAVRQLSGLATTTDGHAHVGTNEPARQDALIRVPAFINGSP